MCDKMSLSCKLFQSFWNVLTYGVIFAVVSPFSQPWVFADDSKIREQLNAQVEAQNRLYLELKKLGQPATPDQFEGLKAKYLAPAREGLMNAYQEDQKEQNEKAKSDFKKHNDSFAKQITQKFGSDPNLKTDSDRQKIQEVLNNANKGDFKGLKLSKNVKIPPPGASRPGPGASAQSGTSNPGSSSSGTGSTAVTTPFAPEVVLDGAAIPKEIEFTPAPKSQSAPAAPKASAPGKSGKISK